MIPSKATKQYLERVLDDHRRYKRMSKKKLKRLIHKRAPGIYMHPDTNHHQFVMIYLGLKYPGFNFWASMGTGKTLVALTLLQYWWDSGCYERAVVCVLSDKAYDTWIRQRKQYGFTMPWRTLDGGTTLDKWEQIERFGNGVLMVAYPSLMHIVAKRGAKKRKGKPLKNAMLIDKKLLRKFTKGLDMVVWDEITKASNRSSLVFRIANQLSRSAQIRYGLAGRPIGRDVTKIWAQQFLVDRGKTFGPTLGMFRAAFFNSEKNRFAKSERVQTHTFNKALMPKLVDMLQHRSITYTEEECIDVPKFRSIIERVRLPYEASEYYKRCKDEIIAARGNMLETKNVFMRMRQISSGFMGFSDEDTGDRAQIELVENPKLERLLELVEEIPEDRQAIIFYEFTWSGRKITQALKEKDISHVWIWSGTKNPRGDLRTFTAGKRQIAVINNRIGSYSLDGLQCANYVFFYESPVSVIDRVQAERRVRRQGQKRIVWQYDLVVKGTMDQRILDFHAEGESIMKALKGNPKAVFRKSNG